MFPEDEDDRPTVAGSAGGRRHFDINDTAPPGGGGAISPISPVSPAEDDKETRWSNPASPAKAPDFDFGGGASVSAGTERETMVRRPATEPFTAVAWVYCMKGLRSGQLVQFKKARNEFGRAADCDFVIEDDFSSAHHGAFLYDANVWKVFDFASSNGTFINGKRLGAESPNPTELNDGDTVTVGDSDFVFKRI